MINRSIFNRLFFDDFSSKTSFHFNLLFWRLRGGRPTKSPFLGSLFLLHFYLETQSCACFLRSHTLYSLWPGPHLGFLISSLHRFLSCNLYLHGFGLIPPVKIPHVFFLFERGRYQMLFTGKVIFEKCNLICSVCFFMRASLLRQ